MSTKSWQWTAYGKHPAARDYFVVGRSMPMAKAFSDWVDKGYQILASKRSSSFGCSFRFWARGAKKETLVLGIGKDSSDSVGRPYPLLIMGTGPLEGWTEQWELLPLAFEKTWSQMEYLSARRFSNFKEFEVGIQMLKSPLSHWSEFDSESLNLTDGDFEGLEKKVASLSKEKAFLVGLDGEGIDDVSLASQLWHSLLKKHNRDIPHAVFVGGTTDEVSLGVYRRALNSRDFVELWTGDRIGDRLEA
ncbi:MAG: DUF2094 domain-containing protein [Deltaproteobacteria bacterium]|nr:DUF2094 domain-containing protein [Deltaproteobacteria bacterium]